MLDEAEINCGCANAKRRSRIKPLLNALPCNTHARLASGVDRNPEEILVLLDKLGLVDIKAANEAASSQECFHYNLAYLSSCTRHHHYIALET
jgi:hypothetical protein